MPVHYARRLAGRDRTGAANLQLGIVLSFVAGATNAGGYLAVRQYTSHMTGIVASMSDELVLGHLDLARRSAVAAAAALIPWRPHRAPDRARQRRPPARRVQNPAIAPGRGPPTATP